MVISSALSTVKKTKLLKVLRNHKGAIAWSITDINRIDSSFCTHKILMEDEFKPSVQHQRRVNPNIKKVVKKEVIKLLNSGLIYPISDSPWVSPVQVLPKKGGMTVVNNKKDELIPQRTVTGWRLIEDSMEVFMEDFSVFGSSFNHCLKNLKKMLKRTKDRQTFQAHTLRQQNNERSTENYTATEKELVAVVFAFEKFCQYLVLSKTIIFTNHSTLRYLFTKQDAKPRLIRWILLLLEFDIEIRDKKGAENLAADHLARLENPNLGKLTRVEIRDSFPEEQLMAISDKNNESWYADYANYLASRVLPFRSTRQEKHKFFSDLRH
ncbi:reverse transcriptase domain-containing protein [Tanacetum coccineum]